MRDVGVNWTRIGFLRILERMGARVDGRARAGPGAGRPGRDAPSRSATSRCSAGPLRATVVEADEVPLAIDELPLVALLGCFAEGETVVRGAHELRVKESDRIAGRRRRPARPRRVRSRRPRTASSSTAARGLRGGTIDARGDHRMAMLGAVAGLASREGVRVVGMEAAAVSYPGFLPDLGKLR